MWYIFNMPVCFSCNLEKPESCYTKDKNRKNGLRRDCKICRVEERKNWYKQNENNSSQYCAKYYQANKANIKAKIAIRQKYRRNNDINYKILCNLRRRLHRALKGESKSKSTQELLGCSVEDLRTYLELKFKQGMTWDNYGSWHIDHIIPCAKFNFGDQSQREECFHFSNLQPLWAIENLRKNAKII